MRDTLIACLILLFALPCLAKKNSSQDVESAIRQVLDAQVEAWNKHDLETFMQGYWRSPELTFFSGGNASHGWDAALDRYRQHYQGGGHQMGQLEFASLSVLPLSKTSALVRGEYHLTMSGGKTAHGLFTLIFRKFPEGWKIIHDHSSAAD